MTSSRRRLLVITPWDRMWSLEGEAGVSDDHHFVAGFTRAGWDVHFLAPEGGGRDAFPGVTLHTYPNFFLRTARWPVALRRFAWMPLFQRIVGPRAIPLAREIDAGFVLGHSHYTAPITARCRREIGIPCGVKLFGVMDLVHTEWPRAKYVFKNFEQLVALRHPQDVWIVLDDGTRGDEILRGRGIDPDRIRFLPNGLDLDWQGLDIDRGRAREAIGVAPGAPVVLFLARLVRSKRPADVIEAAPDVLRRHPEAVFVIAGDGEERGVCESTVERLGIGQSVRFTGTVPHARVPELMAAADVFVTTSSLTNMALPTCEALICGVPVVAYDTGDTSRAVRDGQTGVLVADGDTAALGDAVSGLLDDAALRSRMSARARELARELFTSWDARVAIELDIIGALADKKRRDGGR